MILLERKMEINRTENDQRAARDEHRERDEDPFPLRSGTDDDRSARHDDDEARAKVRLRHNRGKGNKQRAAKLHVISKLLDAPVILRGKRCHEEDGDELANF